MEVFVLMEHVDQGSFTDQYGESATESSSIIGLYFTKEKAQAAMEHERMADAMLVQKYGCDPSDYTIHTMIIQ